MQSRGLRIDLPDADGAPLPGVANPIRYSATPLVYESCPPRLGEHTDEVLETDLGLSKPEISALRAAKVL